MDLYALIEHIKSKGEVKIISRLGMTLLMDCAKEGIALSNVVPGATCSAELYGKIKATAEKFLNIKIFI